MHTRTFFNNEVERRKWQKPEQLLIEAGLRKGWTFMDIGCGSGFFTLPAAKLVGKEGRVYGLDIDNEAIETLREDALKQDLENIHLQVGVAEETILCQTCADMVFFGIVLHDFADPAKVLENAKTMLKHDGLLIDLDWKKEPMDFGPPDRIRFNEDSAANLIKKAGFKVETIKQSGPYHYMITARTKPY